MDLLDLLHSIAMAAKAFGAAYSQQLLEIAAGCLAVLLLCMKVYKYGRDNILKKVKPFMLGEEGFWDRRPRRNIAKHIQVLREGIPIVTVANFKGGVGKSTMVANLAAFFDKAGLRVLLIDFDYQGSLTDAVVKADDDLMLAAVDLIDGKRSIREILGRAEKPIANFNNTDILSSYYTLSRAENRVLFNWLVGNSTEDIRYNLHAYLSSSDVRDAYDIVLIDAAPRLMTTTVNAICASTHVIIPTILDGLSATAALNTIGSLLKLKDTLSPSLKILGIVPTFVFKSTGYKPREADNLAYLKEEIASRFTRRQDGDIKVFEEQRILRKEGIANAAGERVAFFHDVEIRNMFTQLGLEVSKALGEDFVRKLGHERQRSAREVGSTSDNVVQLGR